MVTLILLIAYTDPGKWNKITKSIVLKIRRIMLIKAVTGLTRADMLGKMGVSEDGFSRLER